MDRLELAALKKCRLQFLDNLDVDHVKDHLIQYDVSIVGVNRHTYKVITVDNDTI